MEISVAILISIVSVSFSIFFGLKNNKRSDTKEIEDRVKANTEINMKLDNISNTTSEIRQEVLSIKSDVKDHENRITKLEAKFDAEHDKE